MRQGFWMKAKTILQDIYIALPAGTVLGLVGPNGAGKTTTLKLGAGLIAPESGEVLIEGVSASEPRARKPIGLLTESQYIYPHLQLKEWLMMLGGFSGLTGERLSDRVVQVLDLVDLTGREKQMIRTLSKGQLQRAGLAQALVHDPSILILDEPMSGLDPYWRYRMQKILIDLKVSGKTIIFSSHILSDVERLCDKIILMQDGKIKWEGNLSEMPRKVQGYEAIGWTDNPEAFKGLIEPNHQMVRQPEGSWRFMVSEANKDALLKMAASESLKLESLRPVQEEIEEILFDFNSKN
ncbi:MAG: ABC transporter ATP-binding protein [Bacteroidota bacterium]